jgi:hypothetical protein
MVYHELETFNIAFISFNQASSIVENSGGRLRKIQLDHYDYTSENIEEDSLNFIRKIYEYCPLIENLSLFIPSTNEHFTELEMLLKVCKNLKSLSIIIVTLSDYNTDKRNGEKLLNILIRSKPNNLREIKFYGYKHHFSLISMEEFLNKWRGQNALSIYTNADDIYRNDDYKKLIEKYKNKGIIKDFIC